MHGPKVEVKSGWRKKTDKTKAKPDKNMLESCTGEKINLDLFYGQTQTELASIQILNHERKSTVNTQLIFQAGNRKRKSDLHCINLQK